MISAAKMHPRVHAGVAVAEFSVTPVGWSFDGRKRNPDGGAIVRFQKELSAMGYKYQFITLAGIHKMWPNMSELAERLLGQALTGSTGEGQF